MATPRSNSRRKLPFTANSTALCSPSSKQVFLYDWWLIKADMDSHGRRIGIGGFASRGQQGIRSFLSAPIAKRQDAATLKTVDGMTILIYGHLNRSRALENGFSQEVCDYFVFGFPYDWEEFAALSFDGNRLPASRDDGSSTLKNIFDDILHYSNGASNAKIESSPEIETTVSIPDETPLNHKKQKAEQRRRDDCRVKTIECVGPLTRSRSRPSIRK